MLYSFELYRDDPVWNRWSPLCTVKYDTLCPNDDKFYQVCGHLRSGCEAYYDWDLETKFCKTYACQFQSQSYQYMREHITFGTKILSGLVNTRYASCNGQMTCSNTMVDELGCPDLDQAYICKGETDTLIPADKVCDLKCDCYRCNDEAVCNNQTYGVNCNSDVGQHFECESKNEMKVTCYKSNVNEKIVV